MKTYKMGNWGYYVYFHKRIRQIIKADEMTHHHHHIQKPDNQKAGSCRGGQSEHTLSAA